MQTIIKLATPGMLKNLNFIVRDSRGSRKWHLSWRKCSKYAKKAKIAILEGAKLTFFTQCPKNALFVFLKYDKDNWKQA